MLVFCAFLCVFVFMSVWLFLFACLFIVLVDAYGQCRRRVTVLHFWREIQADTCWWRRRPGPALTVLAVTKLAVSSINLLIINFPASLSHYRDT